MSRVGTEDDLYRRVQTIEDNLRRQQQGLVQGAYNPFLFRPCDYAATANVVLTSVFASITDVDVGAATLPTTGGMRILLFRQTNQIENGIYELSTIDGFLRRAPDMPAGATVRGGARVYVVNGYRNGNRDFFFSGAIDKVVGSTPLVIAPPKGTLIDTQILKGNIASYQNFTTGIWNNVQRNDTELMQLSFTPPVDCWWDLRGRIYMTKAEAAYTYTQATVQLSPADADGVSNDTEIMSGQYNGVVTYYSFKPNLWFKLAAGVAYTGVLQAFIQLGVISSYRAPGYLELLGNAYVR